MIETKSNIKSMAGREAGLRRPQRRWTAEERRIIYDSYNGENTKQLADLFNVGPRVIITMASRMRHSAAEGEPEPWKVKRDKR